MRESWSVPAEVPEACLNRLVGVIQVWCSMEVVARIMRTHATERWIVACDGSFIPGACGHTLGLMCVPAHALGCQHGAWLFCHKKSVQVAGSQVAEHAA